MTWKEMRLAGWGRTAWSTSRVARPETLASLRAVAREAESLVRGAGRSYGDQAQCAGGHVILTERLNRFLAFDAESGLLVAEAGVTFTDLLSTFLPRGWIAPVTPGTGFVTLGGALANDVHGKNHDHDGSFGRHVEWFDLLTADGEIRRVTPDNSPDLFNATVGGMGLTGIVTSLALRMRKAASAGIARTEARANDLDILMERLAQARRNSPFSVAWIDGQARGRNLGRGIVECGEFAAEAPAFAPDRSLTLPVDLPGWVLSSPLIRIFNHAYFRRIPSGGRRQVVPAATFLYPLDAIHGWNRLYGRRGFRQFQCVIPEAESALALRRLLEAIGRSGMASFLAVLKTMGDEGPGFLSFPLRGWSLALDFPIRRGVGELLTQLEAIVLESGGRLYLAKDGAMAPSSLSCMYPRLERFRQVLDEIDPRAHWQSDMARRLGIRGTEP